MKKLLNIELVPRTAWHSNLRNILDKSVWDTLKREAYKKAGYKCSICGGTGQRNPVEAHEKWSYDDMNKVQKLIDIVALCPLCHKVKHIGLAIKKGDGGDAIKHYCRINNISIYQALNDIENEFSIYQRRSEFEWEFDLEVLTQNNITWKGY
ncbi:MAG: HNH endonuclease [Sedimenticola sp.]